MEEKKGYHKLLVWQRSRELVKAVYVASETFPKSEEFGLKGQIGRGAVSVVLNIVEGYRRNSTKDYLHFLNIAQGSLMELEAAFEICQDLVYLSETSYKELEQKRSEVSFLLYKLILAIKAKK